MLLFGNRLVTKFRVGLFMFMWQNAQRINYLEDILLHRNMIEDWISLFFSKKINNKKQINKNKAKTKQPKKDNLKNNEIERKY